MQATCAVTCRPAGAPVRKAPLQSASRAHAALVGAAAAKQVGGALPLAHICTIAFAPWLAALAPGAPLARSHPAPTAGVLNSFSTRRRQHWQRLRRPPAAAAAESSAPAAAPQLPQANAVLDDELSKRPLELDAAGYFIILVDREAGELVADFYTNTINDKGALSEGCCSRRLVALPVLSSCLASSRHADETSLPLPPTPRLHTSAGLACDPATGEVIGCRPGSTARLPARSWRGATAKAVGVEILERQHGFKPCTHLEHACYLGRELQRAEHALVTGTEYVQD